MYFQISEILLNKCNEEKLFNIENLYEINIFVFIVLMKKIVKLYYNTNIQLYNYNSIKLKF